MKPLFPILIMLLFVIACQQDSTKSEEIAILKEQLKIAQSTIQRMKTASHSRLVHIVFLDLKPDADRAAFINEVAKLNAIEEVNNLEIGWFKDLGDSRALSEYEIFFQMDFANKKEYQTYQEHPVHLALKKALKTYLAAPPKTYDYINQ